MTVEGNCQLLRRQSEWKDERGRGLVLSGTEGESEADSELRGVLEGCSRREVIWLAIRGWRFAGRAVPRAVEGGELECSRGRPNSALSLAG